MKTTNWLPNPGDSPNHHRNAGITVRVTFTSSSILLRSLYILVNRKGPKLTLLTPNSDNTSNDGSAGKLMTLRGSFVASTAEAMSYSLLIQGRKMPSAPASSYILILRMDADSSVKAPRLAAYPEGVTPAKDLNSLIKCDWSKYPHSYVMLVREASLRWISFRLC